MSDSGDAAAASSSNLPLTARAPSRPSGPPTARTPRANRQQGGGGGGGSPPRRDQQDDDADRALASTSTTDASPLDFVEWGPPPSMAQRELIFDALNKIVNEGSNSSGGGNSGSGKGASGGYGKNAAAAGNKGDSRGTYTFTWGAGYHGQLGRKFVRGQKKYSAIPMLVEMPSVIRQVTCGGLHTAVVTEEGKVYTWGDGRKGELGHVHDPSLKQTPRLVEMLDHVFITSIACGGSHTVAVDANGFMHSFGWAKFGQLGLGDRSNQKFPKKIDHPLAREIVAVAAGNKHTIAVTRSGVAIAFGANKHAQLGLGDFEDRLSPEMIKGFAKPGIKRDEYEAPITMAAVSCGAIHSCLVSTTGDVYITGFGEYFTANESQHFFPQPTLVELPEPIRSVSCGQAHNLALSVNGNVWAFGSGEYGQLGFGIKGNSSTPRLALDTRNIRQVSAGRYHSFALTDSGILYSWGCGENGQLGLNSDENILLPTVVTPILGTVVGQVSCGEHHTAILTSAPWTKLSPDVHEWLHAAKVEHELKELYLKKTHRGLTTKDLAKLAVEKERWRVSNEARKKELETEEQAYMLAESHSVQEESDLQREMMAALKRDKGLTSGGHSQSMKKLTLPAVSDASKEEGDEEEKTRDTQRAGGNASNATRLPHITKKKQQQQREGSQTERAHHQGGGALAQTAPLLLDGSATMRANHSAGSGYDSTARLLSPGSGSGAPTSRTQFLKETAQMIRRMTTVVHDKGALESAREMHETRGSVFQLRKEYDALVNESRMLQKRAADLRREVEMLEKPSASVADPSAAATASPVAASASPASSSSESISARLNNLNMQLSTVNIKLAETSENRRNYELNIAHLKEEDFEHFNQLKQLRKQNSDTNLYMKKMKELKAQAGGERAKAEAELAVFKGEVTAYQAFVQEQLTQFEGILAIVRAQNDRRAEAKAEREQKVNAEVAQRVDALTSSSLLAERESSTLALRLQSLSLKLRHFEDAFQKIAACTGLNHPEAIINKFYFKSEIKTNLQAEIDEKQHALEMRRAAERELRQELENAKRVHKDKTWRDVEQLAESTREAATRSDKSHKEIERITQRLAFVQEGLVELMRTAEAASGADAEAAGTGPQKLLMESKQEDEGDSVLGVKGLWSPGQSSAVFTRLDATVESLFAAIAREQEHRRLLDLTSQQRAAAAAAQKGDQNAAQQKLFGFNMKHLRMLSQQNAQVEEQIQQQQQQQQQDNEQAAAQ